MATEVISGKFLEWRLAGASKGVSLTTTAAYTTLPRGTDYLQLIGTTYSTAVVARVGLCPWLTIFKTSDSLVLQTNVTDMSASAQDGTTSTTLTFNSFDTAANGNFLYVGCYQPFGGVNVDVQNTNSNASVITVKYRKSDSTWTDITATDNTVSGGASFAQDGTITWTVPTDWTSARLFETGDTKLNLGLAREELFWTRFQWSAAFDATVSANSVTSLPRSTAYMELPASTPWTQGIKVGPGGISGTVALTDAGTALLLHNCASKAGFFANV